MSIPEKQLNTTSKLREPAEWQTVYYDYLYNFARNKIKDKELIKDLIQDTFLAGIESKSRFQQNSSQISWLTAILKYKIYDIGRSKKNRSLIYVDSEHLHELGFVATYDFKLQIEAITENLDLKNFEREIEIFIRSLPEKWQKLYKLKYLCEISTPMIRRKLKLSEPNYWIISHRLRKSLRDWYLSRSN